MTLKSKQLARGMFPKNPQKNKKDHTNALLYLRMVHLKQHSVSKKMIEGKSFARGQGEKLGLEPSDIESFLKTQAELRKTANKFFENPTKTTLWLSGV